jgi:hypothetical protein
MRASLSGTDVGLCSIVAQVVEKPLTQEVLTV